MPDYSLPPATVRRYSNRLRILECFRAIKTDTLRYPRADSCWNHEEDRRLPTTAIVSLLYVTKNGASAGIAVVGNEGIVGIALFMGGESTPNRAVVQSAGNGF
jgi:hypothetical protein